MTRAYIVNFLIFILCVLNTESALSYPMFYKCNSKEEIVDFVPDKNFEDFVKKLFSKTADKTALIGQFCNGLEECMAELRQIVELAKVGKDATDKLLAEKIRTIYANLEGIQKVPSSVVSLQKSATKFAKATHACHQQKQSLPEGIFQRKQDGKDVTLIYYPNKSNYMYVTGCRRMRKDDECTLNRTDFIESGIEDALLMGVDPYVALAIGFMEMGPNGINDLYLDPIGKMAAMGCQGKHVADRSLMFNEQVMVSYGNLHIINAGVLRNERMSSRLQTFLEKKGEKISREKSYLCRSVKNFAGTFSSSPKQGQCCLETNFKPTEQRGAKAVTRALTMENVRKLMTNKFRDKTDPAYRIQRFNGYSKLMGGGESVPAFRSGVNYYEDPAYGYQALDFIVNSLLSNPTIRNMVEDKSKKLGTSYKSILCRGKSHGYYHLDSNFYFKKHKESDRLKVIKEQFDKGIKWENLSSRERRVLSQEFWYPDVEERLNSLKSELQRIAALQENSSKPKKDNPRENFLRLKDTLRRLISKKGKEEGSNKPVFEFFRIRFQTNMSSDEFISTIKIPEDYPRRSQVVRDAKEVYDEYTDEQKQIKEKMEISMPYLKKQDETIHKWLKEGRVKFKGGGMYSNIGKKSDIILEVDGAQTQQAFQPIESVEQFIEQFMAVYEVPKDLENRDEILSKLRELGVKKIDMMKKLKSVKGINGGFVGGFVGGGVGNGNGGFGNIGNGYFSVDGAGIVEAAGTSKAMEFVQKYPDLDLDKGQFWHFERPMTKSEIIQKYSIKPKDSEMVNAVENFIAMRIKAEAADSNTSFGSGNSGIHSRTDEQDVNYDLVMKEYFEKVYSDRSTVGKASDYSWDHFNNQEINRLGSKILNVVD